MGKGLAKSIGISNFNGQLLMDLLRYAKIPPATLQIEHHPYLTQEGLVKYAQSQGIVITAYSSFGPQSFLEMDMQRAKDTPLLMDNPTVKKLSEKHSKTPAQILLRWATQRDVAVIPKSNNQGRLAQNLDVTGWNLEKSELDSISGLNQNLRFNDPLNVSDPYLLCQSTQQRHVLIRCTVWCPAANLRLNCGIQEECGKLIQVFLHKTHEWILHLTHLQD